MQSRENSTMCGWEKKSISTNPKILNESYNQQNRNSNSTIGQDKKKCCPHNEEK